MNDHPTQSQLQAFVDGELPATEAQAVAAHLASGCAECDARLAPLMRRLLPPPSERPEPADYDQMFDRVYARVRQRQRELQQDRAVMAARLPQLQSARDPGEIAARADGVDGWAYCEALLHCAREERYRSPERVLLFATCAQVRSLSLDPQRYGDWAVRDLQALASAELANAYRIADCLIEAERQMADAHRRLAAGSGSPLLLARILDLEASLCLDRRRPEEALAKLERSHAIYTEHGESHLAGKCLIQMSICWMHRQEIDRALEAVRAGLALLDPTQDPRLALVGHHNLIRLLMEKREYRKARQEVFRRRPLYQELGDPLTLLRLRWLEAQISAGLGELDRAETGLKAVRGEFTRRNLPYKAAVVGLELAALWVRQGKLAAVPTLIGQIVRVFRGLGIGREAMAALLVLEKAHEKGALTLGLVEKVTSFMSRLETDPGARFES